LVGRNGAGKSTLLELLAGLERPTGGEVRVFGLDPVRDPVGARRRVGWMTDDMAVWNLPIDQHLRLLAPFYPTWDADLAASLLDRFELGAHRQIGALSKGEQTRARLVMTLAWRPELVLLAEPATGLDVPARRALLGTVLDVVRDGTRTVLISSHQVDDVERICDRVLLLERGLLAGDGTPAEVAGPGRTLEERLAESR
ncbi:MAG: ABC transporter ATP-binding protein, partial [Deltaproteobacteria bacterium]|nr:ABC transporter ATP-binding protein [Deltaproteobacteria bacterium]